MEPNLSPREGEESLEQRLDRINCALQSTMQEIEVSGFHPKNPSLISFRQSYTGSYCNFEWLDQEGEVTGEVNLPDGVEENFELVLQQLDRTQMLAEDLWAEYNRNQGKTKPVNDEIEKYILKLEKENKDLRAGDYGKKNHALNLRKNYKLEQERKNFEDKLAELDFLTCTYKKKHEQINKLEEELRVKEKLLDQKEKELKNDKIEFERTKKMWEQTIVSSNNKASQGNNRKFPKKFNLQDLHVEEAPPPAIVMTPNKSKTMMELQAELKMHEGRFMALANLEEKSKEVTIIDQLKNKIATLRGEEAMMNCSKSSRIMKEMRRTMEKEVNYEENLRKINLERFAVKGNIKISATPTYSTISSKRFLFGDN